MVDYYIGTSKQRRDTPPKVSKQPPYQVWYSLVANQLICVPKPASKKFQHVLKANGTRRMWAFVGTL